VIWPYFLVATSQLMFGSNHILGRAIEGHVPPTGLSFWRWVVALAVVLPFTHRGIRRHLPLLLSHWKLLTALAFFLMVLGNTMIYVALNYTTAINAGVVASGQPAVTFLMSWLIFRERATKGQVAGLAIALVGVLIVILRGDLGLLATLSFNTGDIVMLVAITGFSAYTVLYRKVPREVPTLVVLAALQFIGILLLLPIYIWESIYIRPMALDWTTVGAVLWAGIVVALIAMALLNVGINLIGGNKTSVFTNFRVIAVAFMAIALLGETIQLFHLVSFALILIGLYLVSRAKTGVTPERKAQ
jgi:drug/metabolite transporter (DMT)-like permease